MILSHGTIVVNTILLILLTNNTTLGWSTSSASSSSTESKLGLLLPGLLWAVCVFEKTSPDFYSQSVLSALQRTLESLTETGDWSQWCRLINRRAPERRLLPAVRCPLRRREVGRVPDGELVGLLGAPSLRCPTSRKKLSESQNQSGVFPTPKNNPAVSRRPAGQWPTVPKNTPRPSRQQIGNDLWPKH